MYRTEKRPHPDVQERRNRCFTTVSRRFIIPQYAQKVYHCPAAARLRAFFEMPMRSDRQRSRLPGDALKRSQGAFLRFFSPSPLIPPQPLYQNGLKIDPRGKLLVDKMGHIGIYSEIEAQKNRPEASRTVFNGGSCRPTCSNLWRRVRDLNPSYAINVNTISSRGHRDGSNPCTATKLESLRPTPAQLTPPWTAAAQAHRM